MKTKLYEVIQNQINTISENHVKMVNAFFPPTVPNALRYCTITDFNDYFFFKENIPLI